MAGDRDAVAAALPAYAVGEELGRGAWGVVLAGTHRQLQRAVAIKQLPREFGADPAVRARFLSEARTLASFDHPHIVHIHDFVEHEGLCLLIMDQLTGGTVGTRFRTEGFTPQAACALILATCAGLQYAHDRGVLHRDIKPENLMFSGDGVLKVVDFGIAKLLGGSSLIATQAGSTLGTPAYIAPEQARSSNLTPATDVYAAGTLLFELLAGTLPYPEVADPVAAIYQHIHEDPRPLLDVAPDTPPALAEAVDRAVQRDPSLRPQSAEEFGQAVARAATDSWGPGWSSATGIPLRGDVSTLLPSGERPRTDLATVVSPGTIQPAADVGIAVSAAPAGATPYLAPSPAGTRRRSARGIAMGVAAAIVVAGGSAILLSGHHGTKGPAASPSTSGAVDVATTSPPAGATTTSPPAAATTSPSAVAKAMLDAFNAGNDARAATFFAPPLDILGNHASTVDDVKNLFATSFCGGTIQDMKAAGEQVVVTLKLFPRPGHEALCDAQYRGNISPETITVHNGKVVSWTFS